MAQQRELSGMWMHWAAHEGMLRVIAPALRHHVQQCAAVFMVFLL